MLTPRPAAGFLAAGLIAVLSGAFMLRPGPPTQVGVIPVPRPAVAEPAASRRSRPAAVADTHRVGRPVIAASPPVLLTLPRLGVAARVVPVGVGPGRALGVPDNPAVLGWWSSSAAPGAGSGSIVVDGHVDSARYGKGVFARLRDLHVGERVQLTAASGRITFFTVAGRRSYAKSALPLSVFDQSVGERLVLITCGGRFNRHTAHYSDNVVLYAVPVAGGA